MKRGLVLFWAVLALSQFAPGQTSVSGVRSVYMLPMSNGFEQYIANHLTMDRVLQVVTDPELADAVFTDQIGLKLERQLEELYPPPPEEKPEDEASDEEGESTAAEEAEEEIEEMPVPISTFSRGKGNLFLVDRRSGKVVWSMYHRPKKQTPEKLDEAASKVVENLRESLGLAIR